MPHRNVRVLLTMLLITVAAVGLLYFVKAVETTKIIVELSSIIRWKSLENCSLNNCTALLNYNAQYIIEESDFQPNVVDDILELQELQELQELAEEDLKVTDELSFIDIINIEYQDNHVEVERIVTERMKKIGEYCSKTFNNYKQYNMYSFPEFNLLWVPCFKSGSTTWRDLFIETLYDPSSIKEFHLGLLGRRRLSETDYTRSGVHGSPRKLRGKLASKTPRPISFMQVRHPIDRLISLHLSTSITRSDLVTMGIWGIPAIVMFRQIPDISKKGQYEAELIRYINEMRAKKEKITKFSEDNPYFHPPYPTFSELISYVIYRRFEDTKVWMNPHWIPATEFGDICQYNLDYIIKLENNPMETIFLLTKLKLLEKEGYLLHKHNVSYGNKSVEIVAKKESFKDVRALVSSKYEPWMKVLTKKQKEMLKVMYKDDFYLFNYDDSMLN